MTNAQLKPEPTGFSTSRPTEVNGFLEGGVSSCAEERRDRSSNLWILFRLYHQDLRNSFCISEVTTRLTSIWR